VQFIREKFVSIRGFNFLADESGFGTDSGFAGIMKKYSEKIGGDMISAAESWKEEGRKEGKFRNTVEMIEKFLNAGVGRDVIFQATGIDREHYEKLREKWHK